MDQESINQIISYLDKLGEKLGVGVSTVWPWLVKQQIVESIYQGSVFIVFAILMVVCIFWLHKAMQNEDFDLEDRFYDWLPIVGIVLFGFGFVCSGLVFVINLGDAFNPEYWALKDLLYMVK